MTKTVVTHIGSEAYFDDYPILVLFNEEAPEELKDICVLHRFVEPPQAEGFMEGKKVCFDQEEYTITEVGSVAFENFRKLGHLSFHFGHSEQPVLPGSIRLNRERVPKLKKDSLIEFV